MKINDFFKKKWYVIVGAIILLTGILSSCFLLGKEGTLLEGTPILTIETPQKVNIADTKEITLDVTITNLGSVDYPAASMSISFDSSRLEFMGIEEGNVFVRSGEQGVAQKLPEWSCNPQQCNKTGKINIMYLDTTGGKNTFCKELLAKEDNVVLRLQFRMRGSVRKGDVYDLIFEDAIFAASDEQDSLAMMNNTLKVRNGKIVLED